MSGSRLSLTNGRAENVSTPFAPHPAVPWGSPPRYAVVRPGMGFPSECFGGAQRIVCVWLEWCIAEQGVHKV